MQAAAASTTMAAHIVSAVLRLSSGGLYILAHCVLLQSILGAGETVDFDTIWNNHEFVLCSGPDCDTTRGMAGTSTLPH